MRSPEKEGRNKHMGRIQTSHSTALVSDSGVTWTRLNCPRAEWLHSVSQRFRTFYIQTFLKQREGNIERAKAHPSRFTKLSGTDKGGSNRVTHCQTDTDKHRLRIQRQEDYPDVSQTGQKPDEWPAGTGRKAHKGYSLMVPEARQAATPLPSDHIFHWRGQGRKKQQERRERERESWRG